MLGGALSLLRAGRLAAPLLSSVRTNCPWHRSNWRPHIFPFHMKKRLESGSLEARLKTAGGRELVMRRVLREEPFLGWNHDRSPREKRLSYPL